MQSHFLIRMWECPEISTWSSDLPPGLFSSTPESCTTLYWTSALRCLLDFNIYKTKSQYLPTDPSTSQNSYHRKWQLSSSSGSGQKPWSPPQILSFLHNLHSNCQEIPSSTCSKLHVEFDYVPQFLFRRCYKKVPANVLLPVFPTTI